MQGKQLMLRVLFADTADHRGTITINGNTIPMRGQDAFGVPITQYLRPGDNTLQFAASDKDFEIVRFDVLMS